jgi:hypothetical protein
MHTEDKVEIYGKNWLITGRGIEFSSVGDIITVKKDVTMQIK